MESWENLKGSLVSLILAGTDTSSSFLEWLALYMTLYQDIQEKCYQEIASAIGNRRPQLDDDKNTPYVRAIIQEVTRHCPHLYLTVQHNSTKDGYIEGHFVPRDTSIQYFSGAVMKNPDLFAEPDKFSPERFINSEDGSFIFDERVIYFGTGKRRCAGEVLARAELYLFTTSLIQAFKFMPSESGMPTLDYETGLNMTIKPFWARVIPRLELQDSKPFKGKG